MEFGYLLLYLAATGLVLFSLASLSRQRQRKSDESNLREPARSFKTRTGRQTA